MPIRVAHIIPSLSMGGAEAMLVKVLSGSDRDAFPPTVITLLGEREHDRALRELGIPVINLGSDRGQIPTPKVLWALCQAVRRFAPDVIQGWIYHGNVAATLAGRLVAHRAPVAWNVRHSLHDIRHETAITRWTIRASILMSGAPHRILYNSHTSRNQHEAAGFARKSGMVIPNGFDVDRFRPRAEARISIRQEYGLDADTPLIVQVGRLHPMKGHEDLIQALRVVRQWIPGIVLWIAGPEDQRNWGAIESLAREAGLADRVDYLGPRRDLEQVYAAADLVCLPSRWGEAFPNVVGEAMATATPCVVSEVGDCARIVSDTGRVVAPGDPQALAEAVLGLLLSTEDERAVLGRKARKCIVNNYSIAQIVDHYEHLYHDLAAGRAEANREDGTV